jgi:hypothetical protein
MKKIADFGPIDRDDWPEPADIEHFFLAPPGKRWFFESRNDSAAFWLEGAQDTEHLQRGLGGRIDIELMMWGHPTLGVLLIWKKWDGKQLHVFSSKGDLTRLREWVRSTHADPLPVGLFIPYEEAWKAVKEFLETDGALPKSIEWIANSDLPPNTFPDP